MSVSRMLGNKGRDIISVAPTATIQEASSTLGQKRIGCVLVIDESDAIVGILSERDIVRALGAHGMGCLEQPVSGIMTRDVVTCRESDTTQNVMEQMTRGRFRHLPVIESGRCVGLISIGDVVKERMAEVQREAADMRAYITAY